MKTVIINAPVISPDVDIENAAIIIEGKKMAKISGFQGDKVPTFKADCNTTVVDMRELYVMPGFVDVHTRGALGYDFCDADPTPIFEFANAKSSRTVSTTSCWFENDW